MGTNMVVEKAHPDTGKPEKLGVLIELTCYGSGDLSSLVANLQGTATNWEVEFHSVEVTNLDGPQSGQEQLL